MDHPVIMYLRQVLGFTTAFAPIAVSRTWTHSREKRKYSGDMFYFNKLLMLSLFPELIPQTPKSLAERQAVRAARLRSLQLSACGCSAGSCSCATLECGCKSGACHHRAKACGCTGACNHSQKDCGCSGTCIHKSCGCLGVCSH